MSHSSDLERVRDIVSSAMTSLELILGIDAARPGVRMAVETAAIKAWQRGAKKAPPSVPLEERHLSQDVTPLHSPRVAREVQATRPAKHSPPQPLQPVKGHVQGGWNGPPRGRKP